MESTIKCNKNEYTRKYVPRAMAISVPRLT